MSLVLPKGKKAAVCVSFDMDAWSIMLRMRAVGLMGSGNYGPINFSRGEFGIVTGMPRILNLLDKYGIKATFFVPGVIADTYPDLIKTMHSKGHEIAHHGYFHECPASLNEKQEREMWEKGIDAIKRTTGERPYGYRVPFEIPAANELSPISVKLMVEYGFKYISQHMGPHDFHASKVRDGDVYHFDRPPTFGKEVDLLNIPVNELIMDDLAYFLGVNSFYPRLEAPSHVFENWKEEFDYMYDNEKDGFYMFVLHPESTGRAHHLMLLERTLQYIQTRPDVWFARAIDLANSWKD
ncbi:MAG: polysaccharide deacetylase [Nitrososphaerota archaeon]|jgi:peptidoglycan/xylan/chitin deacetylase (PgdA/CDA1 family)|nr:polysaccharide deacetylase [Nitrososphaerota archaeon]MDG6956886.1 polysaccharide deacetylase [Nitrososphaerota archaeon]MDG6980989.1 polysaccharide deacetylase [Nitrososphaerota archaeon]MDG6984437.1 polysaccharide deacetylase [Nitrososphaerota archaeon]MDG6993941.1 polysaccharide deacetylase [Nitrososphaerota archaeon]